MIVKNKTKRGRGGEYHVVYMVRGYPVAMVQGDKGQGGHGSEHGPFIGGMALRLSFSSRVSLSPA